MAFDSGFSISEAEKKIAELTIKSQEILEQGKNLDSRFKSMFSKSKPALRCIRHSSRSLVIYRWRAYGQKTAPLELLSDEGLKILSQQDEEVKKIWLEFEDERQWLNLQYGLVVYQIRKLSDWVEQQRNLNAAKQKFGFI